MHLTITRLTRHNRIEIVMIAAIVIPGIILNFFRFHLIFEQIHQVLCGVIQAGQVD